MVEEIERKTGLLLGYIERQQEEEKERRESFKIVYVNPNKKQGETETMESYSDGTFRKKGNLLEYRFYLNKTQISVFGITKKECFINRTKKIQENITRTKKIRIIKILSLKDWLFKWYELYKKPYLKDSTNRIMIYHLKMIVEKIGDMPINEITKEKLQIFLNEQTSYSKKRNIKLILNEALDEAFEGELIEKNPAKKLKLPQNQAIHKKALSFEQQNFFIENIDILKYKAVFKILCCTGMRIGELLH